MPLFAPRLRPFPARGLLLLGLVVLVLGSGRPEAFADAAKWRERFTTGGPDEQFTAVENARTAADASAALPLVELALGTPHPHLAVASGEALAAIGPAPLEDADLLKMVLAAVRAKEDLRQLNLARLLAAWGVPAVDRHLAQLASGRRAPEVQAEALFACGMLAMRKGVEFPEVKQAVMSALDKGRTEDIRIGACSAAGHLGMVDATNELITMAKRGSDKYAGLFAVLALQRLGARPGLSGFLHVLGQTPKDDARNACLKAVVELSSATDVPDLLSMTRSSKKDYRDAAALALARLAWEKVPPAGPAITPSGPGPAPSVIPDEVIDRLITMVQEETEWEVRDAARVALLRIGEPAAVKVRQRMPGQVDFSDDDTAYTVMELCGHFGAVDAQRSLLKTAMHEESRTRRMFAARALEGLDAAGAVAELVKGLQPRDKAKDSDLNCVRALGYIRHTPAFDALVKLLETPGWSPEMQREIEYALERLTGRRFGADNKAPVWKAWFAAAKSPLHTRTKAVDRAANRKKALDGGLFGATRETERCVEGGLRFLELQQHVGGWWDGNEKGFGGVIGCEPAYTGLSMLAFLGGGYNVRSGKYCEVIRRGVDFLVATQFYDGSFPVTGGGDESWIFAYLIAMGVWGVNEAYGSTIDTKTNPQGDPILRRAAQGGIDYLVRVQTPGGGWRYGPRYHQSDTSCTSWVLMTLKTADLSGLDLAQRAIDGIDSWLERCSFDITGEIEVPADLASDYDYEVGSRRRFKAFTGYLELSGKEASALQQVSMTAVGMTCRFFMGWKRSHPFQIGSGNYLLEYLPRWMKGLEKGMAVAWYHYFWYYGTLCMYQMGGRYWRAWNERVRRMYPENQRTSPAELVGSWDPDSAVLNGGRLFSTAMSVMTLETYYRFSPLLGEDAPPVVVEAPEKPKGDGPGPKKDEPKKDEPK